ncbi:hypothetical protein [Lyngbya confervoides]|uniref:Uncharacterized protein n=1 Tax=Lyngbya confervoides BDU141951 TaxID=1574623 RepID=A0ABD4T2N6_9CYAN|nr:hypothetical protein [Lyngbya confervoides]MCM1982615.1 hypothetical protein [Lyngbya confervoides BDU141951]
MGYLSPTLAQSPSPNASPSPSPSPSPAAATASPSPSPSGESPGEPQLATLTQKVSRLPLLMVILDAALMVIALSTMAIALRVWLSAPQRSTAEAVAASSSQLTREIAQLNHLITQLNTTHTQQLKPLSKTLDPLTTIATALGHLHSDLQDLKQVLKPPVNAPEQSNIAVSSRVDNRWDALQAFDPTQTKDGDYLQSSLQLLKDYNDFPQGLTQYIEVAETEESQSYSRLGETNKAIELVKRDRGNYWVVSEAGRDYLVPKENLKINTHNLNTVSRLFECLHYHSGSQEFRLIEPAQVSALKANEVWILEKPGVLEFR